MSGQLKERYTAEVVAAADKLLRRTERRARDAAGLPEN